MNARNPARPVVDRAQGILAEPPLSDFDLKQWTAELLDPDGWGEILHRFGETMRVAVALTDVHGRMLGACHNPQPVWSLARGPKPEPRPPEAQLPAKNASCSFCLIPDAPCCAVADALRTGEIAFAQDRAGLAHAAIPMFLGGRSLGVLIAGQTFAQYPQPLALQRVAKEFDASPQDMWNAAVRQVPISHATLRLYADLLASLGHAFLRQRYAAILDRKLHRTDEWYRFMIEGSKDHALFTVDEAGCITSWNPGAERLFGYAESEIKGKDYARFFTPEDIHTGVPKREIRQVQQSGWFEDEGWQIRKDGTRFLSETVTARLGQGDACEYGRLLHDVTQARKSAEEVLEAQKLESIGVLAGGIAHDFNNLLTSILGNVTLASAGLDAQDPARHLLETAERSSLKAAALVTQLLAYAGKGQFVVTFFDLSVLVSEILPLIHTSIPKSVQLELSLPPGLPWLRADASEIQQIIMNLVINGAESIGPEGGVVYVSTGSAALGSGEANQPDGVYFEVRDSGCGMDELTQTRIFEPFFTTKFTGRGLGLAAVSGIIRRLKGRLEVHSTPGEGSTFRVILPGVAPQLAEPRVVAKGVREGTGLILVVDDDPLVRGLASAVLERNGYSVVLAQNGQEAIDLFQRNAESIIAVLMDLTMPVMGGKEAFQVMSEIRPDIPVIISSGFGESTVREQFASGLAGVIKKPYTVGELRDKIAAVLAVGKTAKPRTARASGI